MKRVLGTVHHNTSPSKIRVNAYVEYSYQVLGVSPNESSSKLELPLAIVSDRSMKELDRYVFPMWTDAIESPLRLRQTQRSHAPPFIGSRAPLRSPIMKRGPEPTSLVARKLVVVCVDNGPLLPAPAFFLAFARILTRGDEKSNAAGS